MSDKPIIFSAPMIRALLDGRKSETRRIPQRLRGIGEISDLARSDTPGYAWCFRDSAKRWNEVRDERMLEMLPWRAGDRLWVREGCVTIDMGHGFDVTHFPHGTCAYLADGEGEWYDHAKAAGATSRPSIHMPRWASRITLIVDSVRVERLQQMNRGDAMAEGCPFPNMAGGDNPLHWFRELWNGIHGADAWSENPWVAAIGFRTVLANIDAPKASAP